MSKVLKLDDLMEISDFLKERGYDSEDLEITINVHTKQMLNRVNDDYFYRNKLSPDEKVEDVEEVRVVVGNVNFKYVYDKDSE